MVKVVLSMVVIILVISLAVGFMENIVPMIMYSRFNNVTQAYIDIAVAGGGLTVTEVNQLRDEIETLSPKLSITTTNITVADSVSKGEKVLFNVTATYTNNSFVALLTRDVEELFFKTEKEWANRKIIN